ncbi:MAG: protoheme IX farnesyltransferase [Deltaproteobacteria bacterium]|nr:protoheme IX farnesyltransferase [Deltaproteobacteria bacterium]
MSQSINGRDIVELVKFKLTFFVALSSLAGYALNSGNVFTFQGAYLFCLVFLSAASSIIFNQAYEAQEDRLMRRTMKRPIPLNKISVKRALLLSVLLASFSMIALFVRFGAVVSYLSLITFALYNFVYTPLKKLSPWAIIVGALPGAIPTLAGAFASNSRPISQESVLLFLILFLWQLPHFVGLSVLYKDDYERAGFKIGFSRDNKLFFSVVLVFTVPCLMLLTFYLMGKLENLFLFLLVFFGQLGGVISIIYLLLQQNRESGVYAVKNLSFFLLVVMCGVILT